MEKLLADHRKQLGNFEVVDFVDEKEIEALRQKIDFASPVDVNWTWDYGSEVAELRQLYEKGKTAQWNASIDLDWTPAGFERRMGRQSRDFSARQCLQDDGQGRGDPEGSRF